MILSRLSRERDKAPIVTEDPDPVRLCLKTTCRSSYAICRESRAEAWKCVERPILAICIDHRLPYFSRKHTYTFPNICKIPSNVPSLFSMTNIAGQISVIMLACILLLL
ncbi:hypothetical protein TNCV_1771401 [Trichonephila clavipes]|nr:hypothetical protein TNCV_1771401 [Trichonephila clavipes]